MSGVLERTSCFVGDLTCVAPLLGTISSRWAEGWSPVPLTGCTVPTARVPRCCKMKRSRHAPRKPYPFFQVGSPETPGRLPPSIAVLPLLFANAEPLPLLRLPPLEFQRIRIRWFSSSSWPYQFDPSLRAPRLREDVPRLPHQPCHASLGTCLDHSFAIEFPGLQFPREPLTTVLLEFQFPLEPLSAVYYSPPVSHWHFTRELLWAILWPGLPRESLFSGSQLPFELLSAPPWPGLPRESLFEFDYFNCLNFNIFWNIFKICGYLGPTVGGNDYDLWW